MNSITEEILTSTLIKRAEDSYKGTYGKVLVIGGNEDMGGAAILTASAAVYSGAGLVTVATAKANHVSLHARLPEAMVVDSTDLKKVTEQVEKTDVIVIGPGLGLSQEALDVLTTVFSSVSQEQHVVIDGSAISLMAEHDLPYPKTQVIYTPHVGEWKKMTGLSQAEQEGEANAIQQKKIGGTIVLKSNRTKVYFNDAAWKNTAGNPAMATGGMGDTLAGMIAGFVAQFDDKEKAILAAVFLHSKIGDTLAEKQYVVLPSQIIEEIPYTMKHYSQK
ncbi:NAD(P)H-hydrate dehydratase [Desemzia sp. RIT804]|uniref:NAD(P)H-hydrate dehydratase n=1 Tax=Desemzia sp. RIT 804 TaxID=2810209 RepID=UPI00194F1B79|nr:NAD(P)H-hydrate dehydratase [Desemzia sp. RIT 804]MBM6613300.1 NAD(P)H-hydrate dehydratase [Desemzia sp. RIT 804]